MNWTEKIKDADRRFADLLGVVDIVPPPSPPPLPRQRGLADTMFDDAITRQTDIVIEARRG